MTQHVFRGRDGACLFLGCAAEATHTLVPQYGRRSEWCREHGEDALAAAAFFDNRQSSGARLLPEQRPALPRPRAKAS